MESLQPIFDDAGGEPLPFPPELLAFHGPLRMPRRPGRPHVFANFVVSLDGVVAIDPPRGTGADLSGGNAQDRAMMGVLRAAADAIVVSTANLRPPREGRQRAPSESTGALTAEQVCPELQGAYAQLRAALGKTSPPLQLVVSGSGELDLGLGIFSGAAPALVVTTAAGAERLRAQRCAVPVVVAQERDEPIPLAAVLAAARLPPSALVLLESGPTSTAGYLAEGAVDELFLTVAPLLVGRSVEPVTLALVEGRFFPPGTLGARLLAARRGGSFLFLRYGLEPAGTAGRGTRATRPGG